MVLFFSVFFFFAGWPLGLWWLLLIPVAGVVWVARTRTVLSESGLELRRVFGSRHVGWAQLKGVSIPKRGFVRAHLTDGSTVKLPAVTYDRLRDLIAASHGRIPDLFAAEEAARDAAANAAAEDDKDAAADDK
ncbi:PH domain-containing protein [Nocardia panacis]|uniref:PH domain-containing protein n=1 Tax=Nocardia panacis TaxID=2340916 RepID=A0A3A4KMS0_9NOCA|nr:PH domain-containing protein [Nocardia panacis]